MHRQTGREKGSERRERVRDGDWERLKGEKKWKEREGERE